MEKRMEFSVASVISVINQKIKPNWEVAIQRGQTDIIECDIEKQKYYDKYNKECIAARKAQQADDVAATAAIMDNTLSPIDAISRETEEILIDTLRNVNSGLEEIVDTLLGLWKTQQSVEKENGNNNKESNYDEDDDDNDDNNMNMNENKRKEKQQISRDNDDNSEIRKDPRKVQQTGTPSHELYTIHEELPTMTDEKLPEENKNDNKECKYDEDNDDNNMNVDNNKEEREKEQCEQEHKEEIRKRFRRILDDDDPYDDDTDINHKEWTEIEAEHNLILEEFFTGRDNKDDNNTNQLLVKFFRDRENKDNNDNKDIAVGDGGGAFAADCDDVDDDDDNDSNRNNNNHEEQEESDATQQYPKRTREQVVNDKYILEQQKAAFYQVMEVEL